MKNKEYLAAAVFGIVMLVLVIYFFDLSRQSHVAINNKKINIEIADSASEIEKGLMFREFLENDSGMLFIFPDSEIRNFWMKNTLIPLDIIFINENFEIVDMQSMAVCSDNCLIYSSAFPAKYALEVNSGFIDGNKVSIGDKIRLF